MEELEIIGPQDQPALLAVSTPEVLEGAQRTLAEMGYKVHAAENFEQFQLRYDRVNYQIILLEETFAGGDLLNHPTLRWVQTLSMSHRRHATFFLLGQTMETLNALQAFALSVHCVVNYSEFPVLAELVQKTVSENELFLTTYREAQRRSAQKA
jgi:DNA-binding NtrC family response regulator